MNPGEFKACARELRGIAGVQPLMQVAGPAIDAKFRADIAARAAAGKWVKTRVNTEESQQVLDEVAATVAGVTPAAVLAGFGVVVEARETRHRAGVARYPRQLGIDRLIRLVPTRWDDMPAGDTRAR